MNRLSVGALTCALVLATSASHAQAQAVQPENTPEACSDRVDNDGDGFVDCMDQDCQRLAVCQAPQGTVQPPPGYPPPPPPPPPTYYVPPPPQPYMPMVNPATLPPPNGVGQVIAGSVFLGVGVGLLAGGAWLYDDSAYCVATLNRCTTAAGVGYTDKSVEFASGVSLLVIGSAMTVVGAIFIPVGIIKMGRYNRWKREHHMANLHLEPVLAASAHAGELGFKLTF
jgi:hypothetical protein